MDESLTETEFVALGDKAQQEGRACVAIFQDTDGNWRGGITKDSKWHFVRDVGPETVLQALITHDGQ